MEISHWTLAALAGVVVVNTIFIAGIAVALLLLHRRLRDALAQAGPLLDRSATTLARVEETTARLEEQLHPILERSAGLVDQVADRVDRVSARAEEAVGEPLVGAASLVAGIHRGLQVYAGQTTASENERERNGGQS